MQNASCSICFEVLATNLEFIDKCGHVFHAGCIRNWFGIGKNCPLCKKKIRKKNLKSLFFNGIDVVESAFKDPADFIQGCPADRRMGLTEAWSNLCGNKKIEPAQAEEEKLVAQRIVKRMRSQKEQLENEKRMYEAQNKELENLAKAAKRKCSGLQKQNTELSEENLQLQMKNKTLVKEQIKNKKELAKQKEVSQAAQKEAKAAQKKSDSLKHLSLYADSTDHERDRLDAMLMERNDSEAVTIIKQLYYHSKSETKQIKKTLKEERRTSKADLSCTREQRDMYRHENMELREKITLNATTVKKLKKKIKELKEKEMRTPTEESMNKSLNSTFETPTLTAKGKFPLQFDSDDKLEKKRILQTTPMQDDSPLEPQTKSSVFSIWTQSQKKKKLLQKKKTPPNFGLKRKRQNPFSLAVQRKKKRPLRL